MEQNTKWLAGENETLDDLIIRGLKLIQPRKGYRFSIDAVLLAHFPALGQITQVVDLGCGHGIISLLLAARSPDLNITGIEIQEQMVERARRSVEYNRLRSRIEIICGDYCRIEKYLPPDSVELVVSNPPFWSKGQGRISQNPEEAVARHEVAMSLDKLIAAAQYLLTPGGSLCLVHRCERLADIFNACQAHRMTPVRLRAIHSFADQDARLILVEAQKRKKAAVKIQAPLIIYERQGEYSDEIMRLYYGEER